MPETIKRIENLGRFEVVGFFSEENFTQIFFKGNIKKDLELLLPKGTVPKNVPVDANLGALSEYKVEDTEFSIGYDPFGSINGSDKTCIAILSNPKNAYKTIKLLSDYFK